MLPELAVTGPAVVIGIRVVAPILILRWPLTGVIVAILVDILDVVIVAAMQSGTYDNYTSLDKILDTYALGYAVAVSLHWKNKLAKHTSIVLFVIRLTGVLVLFLTGYRWVLFAFPNIFELFFVYHLLTLRGLRTAEVDGMRKLAVVLILLALPKMVQEYELHVGGFLPVPYILRAAVATVFCCLPAIIASITYIAMHRREVKNGRIDDAQHAAVSAKSWGLVTVAMGAGLTIFWIGLAGLNLTVSYGQVFSA